MPIVNEVGIDFKGPFVKKERTGLLLIFPFKSSKAISTAAFAGKQLEKVLI